ncbi:MAG: ArnT family glycosyltransferase [Planctomycetota bacterium]
MNLRRSDGLLVAALAALVLLPNLGGPPLWDEDEPRNAACSLAMWAGGDWIVPTFNGRLRVEKPALVNWLHLAGFATAGVNETGARIGSALLTLGTCLLTWRIAGLLFRPDVALWSGIVMATCLWTGIAGRAATPDAPLAFFTTLALWLFVRGSVAAGAAAGPLRDRPVRISPGTAAAIGAACGLAVLTKGPVGLALPLVGLGLFAWWQAAADPGRDGPLPRRLAGALADAWRGLRPLTISAVATAVAAPWYVAVTVRTDGAWLREFLLVHNVGRFAAPMEGHSGSPLLYYPLVILVGLFPWSMASALIGWRAVSAGRMASAATPGMRLVAAWLAAWIVPFSIAGTKLPGYVWPAYPALACAVGLFVADWIRSADRSTDRWMRWAWAFLVLAGAGLGIGLPLAIRRLAPGGEWLGLVGLVPLLGGLAAWAGQSLASRRAAAVSWAATACGTVAILMAAGPAGFGHAGGTRHLLARLPAGGIDRPIAAYRAPASTTFYAGLVAAGAHVADLDEPAAVASFVAEHPGAPIVVDARWDDLVAAVLPDHYGILRTVTVLPESRELVLFGSIGEPPRPPHLADAAGGSTDRPGPR